MDVMVVVMRPKRKIEKVVENLVQKMEPMRAERGSRPEAGGEMANSRELGFGAKPLPQLKK